MADVEVQGLRRFNREVAERIGALTDQFLGRARPMGEARVLWEIGPDGTEVRALRARLALDSGYTSRVLRSLERQSLVRVGPSPDDRRVRRVELTEAGRAERAELDRRSDDLAVEDPRTPRRPPTCAAHRRNGGSGASASGIRGALRHRGSEHCGLRGGASSSTSPSWTSASTRASTRRSASPPTPRS